MSSSSNSTGSGSSSGSGNGSGSSTSGQQPPAATASISSSTSTPTAKPAAPTPTSSNATVSGTTVNAETSTSAKASAAASKGYTNPALQAMGIKRVRLPSRNWSIFLSVSTLLIGGVIYDKQQQKKHRAKWMSLAETKYGSVAIPEDTKPRKVTIFIAPPPNDYLEESYKMFRRFVKPVLNAGGVDFEVVTGLKQGMIRYYVASKIRNIRREIDTLEAEHELQKQQKKKQDTGNGPSAVGKAWNYVASYFTSEARKQQIAEEEEKRQTEEFQRRLKNMKNVLGVYYSKEKSLEQQFDQDSLIEIKEEDALQPDLSKTGGVICFGRGVYKEYLSGVHEGLLGPLHRPTRVIEELAEFKHEKLKSRREKQEKRNASRKEGEEEIELVEVKSVEELAKEIAEKGTNLKESGLSKKTEEELKEEEEDQKHKSIYDDEDEEDDTPVVGAYLLPNEYQRDGKLAPELQKYYAPAAASPVKIPTSNNIAPFFQQPVSVMSVPHKIGFLSIPERIYRFYNRRYLADEYGKLAYAVVESATRPFDVENDENLAAQEELDWPKKWVQSGKDKNSDWVRDFHVDERVVSKMWVFDASKVVVAEDELAAKQEK